MSTQQSVLRFILDNSKKYVKVCLQTGDSIKAAARNIIDTNLDKIPIVNIKNELVGIISWNKIFEAFLKDNVDTSVAELMDVNYSAINLDSSDKKINDFVQHFIGGENNTIPLVKDGKFYGLLFRKDLKEFYQKKFDFMKLEPGDFAFNVFDFSKMFRLFQALANDSDLKILMVDEKGIIRFFNKGYEILTKLRREDAIGKDVSEIFHNARLPSVLKTGKSEVRYYKSSFDDSYMVSKRIPLKEENSVIGGLSISLFRDIDEMEELVEKMKALEKDFKQLQKEFESLNSAKYTFENILGSSDEINETKTLAKRYASAGSPILITGETGTGKELFAHAIHSSSPRKNRPFIVVNCLAIPKELLESILFGYEGGAFTGAAKEGRPGKFEFANKGTIFLDEVGDIPLEIQPKLLRVLQENEVERIGGQNRIPVDFRLIAATNRNLEDLVKGGLFRADLYFRLNVLTLYTVPFRRMKEDIPNMALNCLSRLGSKLGKQIGKIDDRVIELLKTYNWPGNVREFQNVLEYAVNGTVNDKISMENLPNYILSAVYNSSNCHEPSSFKPLKELRSEFEKKIIMESIKFSGGNKKNAAISLGISRPNLYKIMKRHSKI